MNNKEENQKLYTVFDGCQFIFLSKLNSFRNKHQLIDFIRYELMLNTYDVTKRYQMIRFVKKQIRNIWKESTVVPFGSFHQHLSYKNSDVDLCVYTKHGEAPTWNEIEQFMEIMQLYEDKTLTFIRTAKIPVIILYDGKYSIKIDISFSYYNKTGSKISEHVKSVAFKYGNSFRMIIIFVKYLREISGLNDYNENYIHDHNKKIMPSFLVILMVIYFFENKRNKNNEKGNHDHHCHEDFFSILVEFFYFYSYQYIGVNIFIKIFDQKKNIENKKEFEKIDYQISCYTILPLFRQVYFLLNEIS